MPTAKPRITITLEPGTYRLLSSLAYHQGVSISSIVTDLIGTAQQSLEQLDAVLEHAAGAPAELLKDMEKAFSSFDKQLDLLQEDAEVERARTEEHGRKSASAAPRPPTSNRGVRNPPPKSAKSIPARPSAKLKEFRK